jgi:hypothetical protein
MICWTQKGTGPFPPIRDHQRQCLEELTRREKTLYCQALSAGGKLAEYLSEQDGQITSMTSFPVRFQPRKSSANRGIPASGAVKRRGSMTVAEPLTSGKCRAPCNRLFPDAAERPKSFDWPGSTKQKVSRPHETVIRDPSCDLMADDGQGNPPSLRAPSLTQGGPLRDRTEQGVR